MRIVFASYVYTPEFKGPKEWLSRINFYAGIQAALALKHNIISIEQIDYEGEYLHQHVQYYFKRFSKAERRFPYQLNRFIKGLEPDVVFINGLHFSLQIIQLRLYLGPEIKVIAQHHAEQAHTGIRKNIQQLADRCVDAYLFASRDIGLDWVNKGNLASPGKIHEVMEVSSVFYPVDKDYALAKTGITGAPVFLWVGRLEANKDPLTVVKAFLNFVKVNTSARLYMIYQTEELLSQIAALLDTDIQYRDSIILIGRIAHVELLYWFNSADFILSGSHYEGSGTVICEAMSCGCIPIITNIPSFRMMTGNGSCGLLHDAGNQQALVDALLQTMQMNMDAEHKKALTRYHEKLSFEAIAGKIAEVAESL